MATTDTWIGKSSADWGASAANWSVGLPNSNNNVVIDTSNIVTVTYGGGDGVTFINSLTVGNDIFDLFGGALTIKTTVGFADGFTQTGGTLSAGGTVTIGGSGTLTGGAAEGDTAFEISGKIALANYLLGGSAALDNIATTNQTGGVTLGDDTGIDATINNEKGAVFDIAGDYGIAQGAATANFVNAGTMEKTGGNSTSFIDVNLTDTGAIIAATGIVEFRGPNDSFAGAISGAGDFALGSGSHDKIASGATIATAGFLITDNGTLVTLGESANYAGAFTLTNSATLNLAGFTLAVSGSEIFTNSSVIEGSGRLVTAAGSDATVSNFTLGGTVDWQNSGNVGETATLGIGDGSAHAATFTNEKGGVFDLTNDNGMVPGAAENSSFVNLAGATLEKTGGNGTSVVSVDVVDSGAIAVGTGAIEFEGSNNSFAGPISGAGQFLLGRGSVDLIGAGATITAGTFAISDNNTLVTLGENLNYAHVLDLENAATLGLGGFTLTLSGSDSFGVNVTVDGSGTLLTLGGSSTNVSGLTLGGSVEWQNSGTVGEANTLEIGDASFATATFTNEKSGVYKFTNDSGITIGAALDSSFVNLAGATLEKTGGGGISQILTDVVDSGAIAVNTGTIEFEGIDNSIAGAISGAGQFALGRGSSDVIASGTTITATTFDISDSGTSVTLDGNLSYAHNFDFENGAVLDPGGFILTLSGTDTFANSSAVEGNGTLVTAHGGTAEVNSFTLGGAVDWQNSGTVLQLASLTIGDASFDAATVTNEKGGIYNFVNNSGIGIGTMPNSSFVNLAGGVLEKTGGTGDSAIAVPVTNDGAVTVTIGTIEFQNTVGGVGSFTVKPGAVLQFDASVAAGSSVDFASTAGGDLLLFDSRQFRAALHGFGGSNTDEIELRDINFSSSTFKLGYSGSTTSGVLTVTDGSNTAHLTMFGNYRTANFHASADPFGGTKIVDPPSLHALLAVPNV